jgi:hypothetical protein
MMRKTLAGLLIAMGLFPSQLAAQEVVADEAATDEALVPP